jgi:histidinol-phosphate aminotransferase
VVDRQHQRDVMPSQANFFMVHLRRDVEPVIQAFRDKGILVGRPFPPMTEHLRVSVGVPREMDRFLTAFKAILPRGGAQKPAKPR